MDWIQKTRGYLRDNKMTQEQMAERLGITQGALGHWLNKRREPSLDDLTKLAGVMGLTLTELLGESALPAVRGLVPVVASDDVTIPQFDTGGMGGHGLVLQDQPGIIENWQVSREWAKANIPSCTSFQNLCIVTGFGDSMPDAFNPGDPVIVDMGVRTCTHDGVYFFRVGNEGFIKILQRIPGVGIMAISQNKNYRDWPIRDDMDFQVFGKVLKAWKGKNY